MQQPMKRLLSRHAEICLFEVILSDQRLEGGASRRIFSNSAETLFQAFRPKDCFHHPTERFLDSGDQDRLARNDLSLRFFCVST